MKRATDPNIQMEIHQDDVDSIVDNEIRKYLHLPQRDK